MMYQPLRSGARKNGNKDTDNLVNGKGMNPVNPN
jgi:hypothetical protein